MNTRTYCRGICARVGKSPKSEAERGEINKNIKQN
jgi:hypothetical protein